jgi:hypothetical protein
MSANRITIEEATESLVHYLGEIKKLTAENELLQIEKRKLTNENGILRMRVEDLRTETILLSAKLEEVQP